MKTLVMVASTLAAAVLLADEPTSASYMQSGLVAQWDAIDNAGTGSHSASATTWKDLVGSHDLTLDTAKCAWTEKTLHSDSATGFAVASEAITTYKTIEICYRPADTTDPHCIVACGSTERFTWSVTNVVVNPGAMVCAAATYGDLESTSPESVYLNGAANADVAHESWGTQPSVFSVGWGVPADRTFRGDICAIRLYDRALTAAEIAANAAVDVARFGIANGASTDDQGRLVLAAEAGTDYAYTTNVGDVPGLRKVGGGEVTITNHPGALTGTLSVEGGTLTPHWSDTIGSPTSVVVAAGATLNYAGGVSGLAADVTGTGTIRFAGTSANTINGRIAGYGRTDSTLAGYFPFETSVTQSAVGNLAPYEDGVGTTRATLVGDGVCGKALRLIENNGDGSFLRIPCDSTMPSGSEPWTFSCWIRPRSDFDGRVYFAVCSKPTGSKAAGNFSVGWSKGGMWYFTWNSGKLILSTHGWTTTYGDDNRRVEFNLSSSDFKGAWHHVVGTYDSSSVLSLYYDGVLKASQTIPTLNIPAACDLQLGDYSFCGNDRSNADYDEVQYCKGAWSAATVAAEYAAKKPPVSGYESVDFAGLWQTYAANVSFGGAGLPTEINAASSLEVANGGYFRFFGDQTVASLSGAGLDGGVDIAAGTTLTVNDAADKSFAGRLAGGGDFVKDGAGTLTLSGASCLTGTVEVKAGTLKLAGHAGCTRADSTLCGYWAFEDETDVGRNSSPLSGNDLVVNAYLNPTVEFVNDGVSGKALHMVQPKNETSPTYLLTGNSSANLPNGTDDFTISFWMRMPSNTSQVPCYAMRCSAPLVGNVSDGWTDTGWTRGWWFTLMANNSFFFGPLNGWKNPYNVTEAAKASGCAYSNSQWHHVVGTRAGTAWKLYFDGAEVASYTHGSVVDMGTDLRLQIGNYNCHTDQNNYNYNGDWDEIQFCKGAWSAATVAAEYAAKRPNVKLAQAALPEPVAHWTFDKLETVGDDVVFKDSGPLGLHFRNNASGGRSVVCRPHADGTPGGAAYYQYSGAYLDLLPSVTNASHTQLLGGQGAPDFTLNVRVANLSMTTADNRSPFVCFGDVASASRCVRLSYEGQYVNGDEGRGGWDVSKPRIIRILAGGDNSNDGYAIADTWSTTSAADPMWTTLTLTFKGREMKVYRDGTYVTTRTAKDLGLKLYSIALGKTPWGTSYGYMFDDLRVYNCTLTDEQVKALVRSQALGEVTTSAPVLSAAASVKVDAGATLALDGAVQPLAALSGAGDVTLANGLTQLGVADLSGFTGTFTGAGRLALADGARYATTVGVDATIADGALKLSLAQKGVPFVKTTGKFILPMIGSLKLTDATGASSWTGEIFQLAECAAYEGPADTTGWTFDPADAVRGRFLFRGGKVYLRMSGCGAVILVR